MILELLKNPPVYYSGKYNFHVLDASGKPIVFIKNRAYRPKPSILTALNARAKLVFGGITAVGFCLMLTASLEPPIWVALTVMVVFMVSGIWFCRGVYSDYINVINKEKPIDFYLPAWHRRLVIYWTMVISSEFDTRTNLLMVLSSLPLYLMAYVFMVDEGFSLLAKFGATAVIFVFLMFIYISIIVNCIYRLFLSKRGWRCQPDIEPDQD